MYSSSSNTPDKFHVILDMPGPKKKNTPRIPLAVDIKDQYRPPSLVCFKKTPHAPNEVLPCCKEKLPMPRVKSASFPMPNRGDPMNHRRPCMCIIPSSCSAYTKALFPSSKAPLKRNNSSTARPPDPQVAPAQTPIPSMISHKPPTLQPHK